MSYCIMKQADDMGWVKLSGKLTLPEYLELQNLGKESLEKFGRFKLLIELDDFQGWSKDAGWEQTSFLKENQSQRSMVAVVGDEKWKDDIYMFMGTPLRALDIEFFQPGRVNQALAWLTDKR